MGGGLGRDPRHLLVPTAYQQQPDGTWAEIDTRGPGLPLAYSSTTLVTGIDADGRAVSSSTKPDLMVRMLEILAVHSGHTVLEIGTGTGYNAALLAHRLGDEHVFSVDVDAELVAATSRRLAAIGRRPNVAARDGIDGWPEHAPYDRIIATCSVPRVPWTWAQQLTPGGKVLVDLKLGTEAGTLVLLHRHDDRLEGRFTGRWAAFMGMRHHNDGTPVRLPKAEIGHRRTTTGPTRLWDQVEHAYQRWQEFHQPGWERFGLTVTSEIQTVWLDEPHRIIQVSDQGKHGKK